MSKLLILLSLILLTSCAEEAKSPEPKIIREEITVREEIIIQETIEIIELCDEGGEILLRLIDGTLIGHYSSRDDNFLFRANPGVYITTDGENCLFEITDDLEVIIIED